MWLQFLKLQGRTMRGVDVSQHKLFVAQTVSDVPNDHPLRALRLLIDDEDSYKIGYDAVGIWSYSASRQPRTWGIEVPHEFVGKLRLTRLWPDARLGRREPEAFRAPARRAFFRPPVSMSVRTEG
jgi:hypothetical protein